MAWSATAAASPGDPEATAAKPRVVITADPELDDANSLIRYLLYSADFRTEGLIYASSGVHWKGDGKGTKLKVPGREYQRYGRDLCPCTSWRWNPDERFIDLAVDTYAKVYPNLIVHDPDYPAPASLRSKILWGNVAFDGDISADTPGSDRIKALLLDDDPAPIYLHAWGGQSTIARALKSVEDDYAGKPSWAAIRAKVIGKAVIYPSGDQDDTYAKYIKPRWPEIRYRLLSGGVNVSYNAQSVVSESDSAYFTPEWTRVSVSSKGPFGSLYRVWGDGKIMVHGDSMDYFGFSGKSGRELTAMGYIVWLPLQPKGAFLAEGDTPTFLNLIDNGLEGYRDSSLGGWGGYQRVETGQEWPDVLAMFEKSAKETPGEPWPFPRSPTHPFLAAAQRDFAARMVWSTTPRYTDANHNPVIAAASPAFIAAAPGTRVDLNATTSDPDGNQVTLRWWRWDQVDSYNGSIALDASTGMRTGFTVPSDAAGKTIHIVLEAIDDGAPPLTRYRRFVVTVAP